MELQGLGSIFGEDVTDIKTMNNPQSKLIETIYKCIARTGKIQRYGFGGVVTDSTITTFEGNDETKGYSMILPTNEV